MCHSANTLYWWHIVILESTGVSPCSDTFTWNPCLSRWNTNEILSGRGLLFSGKKSQPWAIICRYLFTTYHGPLARYVKLWVAHAPGMPGTFFPPLTSKGNHYIAIPACITARASRTCRDACRDRLPTVAGKTLLSGLLSGHSGGTKPLSEPILTYQQSSHVTFTSRQSRFQIF